MIAVSLSLLYKGLFDEYSRRLMKKRFISHLEMQKQKAQVLSKKSEVSERFEKAELPYLNNMRYALLRLLIILFILIGFGPGVSLLNAMLLTVLAVLGTEPIVKYSLINLFLNARIKRVKLEKEGELFNLFALFKTDIMTESQQQINVYKLVNSNLPYFNKIRPTLIQFLQVWTKSPEEAGKQFTKDLTGESAEFLGDFMGKLDQMNKDDALHLLQEQSEIFSHKRAEQVLQRAEIQRNGYYLLFFLSSFSVVGWFMWFMYDMTMKTMNL